MYDQDGAWAGLMAAYWFFVVVVSVWGIICMWRIFTKAGQPGWAAIIPFYNTYIMLKIVGRPGWWLVLFFIPLVNIVIGIMVSIDLAKCFGHGGGFAVGLILLSFIFYGILAFDQSQYRPPQVQPAIP